MSFRGHPLAYPVTVTIGALAISFAWAPFGGLELRSVIAAVAVVIVGYSAFRLANAFLARPFGAGRVPVRRVRQQYRLTSRSWLEVEYDSRKQWLPVYFDPVLLTLPPAELESVGRALCIGDLRVYPAGRVRDSEPIGRLIDNPTRPDPDGPALATKNSRWYRRLLLDAQSAVAAPFVGLFWAYVSSGGFFDAVAAMVVAAVTFTWWSAIRGSDPS